MNPLSSDQFCGCGKPVRYSIVGRGACNKYTRCMTYEEQTTKISELLDELNKFRSFREMVISTGKEFEASDQKVFTELSKCVPCFEINQFHAGSGDNVGSTTIKK
ncbi:MAG: hypothetical protein QM489_00370 [Candidatus Izemoplasma sp.]